MIPGEIIVSEGVISLNSDREAIKIKVSSTGDRPVQIGSHYHFFEVNEFLKFNREKTYGYRLNIPAGTAVRFEPGQTREVELIPYTGSRHVFGFNNLVNGKLTIQ